MCRTMACEQFIEILVYVCINIIPYSQIEQVEAFCIFNYIMLKRKGAVFVVKFINLR
jgi:hypothetical protein